MASDGHVLRQGQRRGEGGRLSNGLLVGICLQAAEIVRPRCMILTGLRR
jgi:hypothetical protein